MAEQSLPIRLAAGTFDPRRDSLPQALNVSPELVSWQPAPEGDYFIVQLHDVPSAEERARLHDQYGLKLTEHVPDRAYVEWLNAETRAALDDEPNVRATVPYQPAFKIDPAITAQPLTDERVALRERRGLWLDVTLFEKASIEVAAERVKAIVRQDLVRLDDRERGGAVHLRFGMPPADFEQVKDALAMIPGLRWIEELPNIVADNVRAAKTLQSGSSAAAPVWAKELHGEGQIIGIIDTGRIDLEHCFFKDNAHDQPGDEHRKVLDVRFPAGEKLSDHATFVAGCVAGDASTMLGTHPGRGGAWAAKIVAGTTTGVGSIDGGVATTLLEQLGLASDKGATIHTNSWHDSNAGKPAAYTGIARATDIFTWNDEFQLVLGSAGNGVGTQGPPGTALNAICVAAAKAEPHQLKFGSGVAGPTAEGRRKPDLLAPGCSITSSKIHTDTKPCKTDDEGCASSYATPHAAAAAALVRQYYLKGFYPTGQAGNPSKKPTAALIKATLIGSTVGLQDVPGPYPGDKQGWGVIRLNTVLRLDGSQHQLRVWDVRHANGLSHGGSKTHEVRVTARNPNLPLRVTLAWTSPPITVGTAPVDAINNLDLEVISPDGTKYLGNHFAGGVSVPGGAPDTKNNVEGVIIPNPALGVWKIRVKGTAINAGNPNQGYAVVATGAIE